ncbi:NAD-dependent epimerase/dehydratase family protein [Accumulibacter sp.]|uniref:NAD-dependent epimerase/dehydratase family protein n=1 Tax=Accumulibacter sp. TaxID=2053492 RepID=UPI0025F453DB|nr:NAD-dependent epimerase/dehydratase family protein [Accumulibacter sp.]MCM8611621.1 NAD-dependent epimerase/dehydratase family protein [Accumulibacter sp.]MCM8635386.1 NAD-dependent epimerase/dehydratase family protein [Accumulibacter sp.]MCM8638991.1 NAD-dependent epimerase/dehydratase family protein [Accumulibacter sp.]
MTRKATITGKPRQNGAYFVQCFLRKGYKGHGITRRASLFNTECGDSTTVVGMIQLAQESEIYNVPAIGHVALRRWAAIVANNAYPVEFSRDNLATQDQYHPRCDRSSLQSLVFLGSSRICPKLALQPIENECLLAGPLQPTNRPYALDKIASIEMCWSCSRRYGTKYLAMMPTNLYSPGDYFRPESSHVIPTLICKFNESNVAEARTVTVWGTGRRRREFLYSEDTADTCVFLMNLPDERYNSLQGRDKSKTGPFDPALVNIGVGDDATIRELAETVKLVVGYKEGIVFDTTLPDGTPRKSLDVAKLNGISWKSHADPSEGLREVYIDYHGTTPAFGSRYLT